MPDFLWWCLAFAAVAVVLVLIYTGREIRETDEWDKWMP